MFENKKAQFYLIAAIIFIAIIVGLVSISNNSRTNPRPSSFDELSENFEIEAIKLIDKGVAQGRTIDQIQLDLENFALEYTEYSFSKSSQVGFLYVFGNSTNVTVVNFLLDGAEVKIGDRTSTTSIAGGNSQTLHRLKLSVGGEEFVRDYQVRAKEFKGINLASGSGDFVKLNIGGIPYNIAVKGQTFNSLTIECVPIQGGVDGEQECFVEMANE